MVPDFITDVLKETTVQVSAIAIVALGICFWRKIVLFTRQALRAIRRFFNRLRNKLYSSKRFAAHAVKFRQTVREKRRLVSERDTLKAEIGKLRSQLPQGSSQITKEEEELLLFAARNPGFEESEAITSIGLHREYIKFLLVDCTEKKLLKTGNDFIRKGTRILGIINTYELTTEGRRILFDSGLLSKRV